jgi:hypothetical protein
MNVETGRKRDLLTHWAIRNVEDLGMTEVCKTRKRMMRKTYAEIREFVAADKRERKTA